MKIKRLISALALAFLVMGPMTHGATHEVSADEAHEFEECCTCSNAAAAVDAPLTYCAPKKPAAYSALKIAVVLSTHFNNYSSRAPPTKQIKSQVN